MEGRLHLLEAVGELNLARERDDVALVDLVGDPGLAEEGRLDDAGLVQHVHLHDLHAGRGRLSVTLSTVPTTVTSLAHVGHADGHDVGEVEVAMRHMQEQVAHAQDAQALERLGARSRDIAQPRDVIGSAARARTRSAASPMLGRPAMRRPGCYSIEKTTG